MRKDWFATTNFSFTPKGRAENARVENGALVIEGRREPFRGRAVHGGQSGDAGPVRGPVRACRDAAKLPAARGTWPAFWMMGEDIERVGWPRCGEIDIMEHVGHNPGVIHANVHQIGEDGKHWSKGGSNPGSRLLFRVPRLRRRVASHRAGLFSWTTTNTLRSRIRGRASGRLTGAAICCSTCHRGRMGRAKGRGRNRLSAKVRRGICARFPAGEARLKRPRANTRRCHAQADLSAG
jgi:hypothetical protein